MLFNFDMTPSLFSLGTILYLLSFLTNISVIFNDDVNYIYCINKFDKLYLKLNVIFYLQLLSILSFILGIYLKLNIDNNDDDSDIEINDEIYEINEFID